MECSLPPIAASFGPLFRDPGALAEKVLHTFARPALLSLPHILLRIYFSFTVTSSTSQSCTATLRFHSKSQKRSTISHR